jgi:DNA-binding CsgD family transcriptional regulator/catechol 2,3-dioxygenase-like lactoylglutathione lyase family enzyme
MTTRRGRGRPPHPDVLTPAEWAVLDWLRHGLSRRRIARQRGTSLDAVKFHLDNIAGKLGVEGTHALRAWPGIPADSIRTPGDAASMTDPTALAVRGLGQVSMLATDIGRAEAFYRDVLHLPHAFTFGDLAFFMAGETRVFLRAVPPHEWRPSSILYLVVDEIGAAHAALAAAGVTFQGAPHRIHTHDDGTEEWMAFFDDPEGNTLALMARVPPPDAG